MTEREELPRDSGRGIRRCGLVGRRQVKTAREEDGRAPPVAAGLGLRLTLAEESAGPLTLGYNSHFGLEQVVVPAS